MFNNALNAQERNTTISSRFSDKGRMKLGRRDMLAFGRIIIPRDQHQRTDKYNNFPSEHEGKVLRWESMLEISPSIEEYWQHISIAIAIIYQSYSG